MRVKKRERLREISTVKIIYRSGAEKEQNRRSYIKVYAAIKLITMIDQSCEIH